MKIEYIKDKEPHFKGSIVTVADEVGAGLIENGFAKEVDPRTEEKNVAADVSQDGMSLNDKRKRDIAPKGYEGDPVPAEGYRSSEVNTDKPAGSDVEDEYTDMSVEDLKGELEAKGLPTSGKKAELQARLRENK
jgi:hypothetical protein